MNTERPEIVKDEHLIYLDNLRESGVTNMFGAAPYLIQEYPILSRKESNEVVKYWMKTFRQEDR